MTGMHLFELTFFCILGAGCGVAVVALLIGAVVGIFKVCGIIIDSVMKQEMEANLPDIPYIFFSSQSGEGITNLKDMLWKELEQSNKEQ